MIDNATAQLWYSAMLRQVICGVVLGVRSGQFKITYILYRVDIYFFIELHFYFLHHLTFTFKTLFKRMNHSQTIIKLNPMNSPRTPPQSATIEPNENASSSFWICIELLENAIFNQVLFTIGATVGSSVTWGKS